jgi:hypothetical protein
LSHLPATILIDSGAMVYTTTSNVKQKAGVPWTWAAHAALPSQTHTLPSLRALHGSREGLTGHRVVESAVPSLPWECRARGRPGQACRRVEEVVVCRRGGCAVQDEPGLRRSYCHAKATIQHCQCEQL